MASVDNEDCYTLLEKYRQAGVAPRVWDVTSDIRVSTFVCDIPPTDDQTGIARRFRGAGCHPNRGIALARALTEAAQIRLTYISGNRDDLPSSDYEESQQEKLGAALLDAVSQDAEPRDFCDIPNYDSDDLALDLNWELRRLQSVGVRRVIAIDLTRSNIGIPVVRIVIPGLEWDCTHPDYVPGARARRAGLDNQ
jgi:ribosomal protein S12 methylthiotransferase accessory factor